MSCRLCEGPGGCPLHVLEAEPPPVIEELQEPKYGPLIEAWMLWDAHPHDPHYVHALEAEIRSVCAAENRSTLALRSLMAAGRREGLSYEAALKAAINLSVPHSETAT